MFKLKKSATLNNHGYIYKLLYINLMITTNQKSIMYKHTQKGNESKHNTKDNHQITRDKSKRRNQKQQQKQHQNNYKMAIRTYISTITLNVN